MGRKGKQWHTTSKGYKARFTKVDEGAVLKKKPNKREVWKEKIPHARKRTHTLAGTECRHKKKNP